MARTPADAEHNRPFRRGKIACVEELFGRYSEAEFGPRNRAVDQIVANPKESQSIESTRVHFRTGSQCPRGIHPGETVEFLQLEVEQHFFLASGAQGDRSVDGRYGPCSP